MNTRSILSGVAAALGFGALTVQAGGGVPPGPTEGMLMRLDRDGRPSGECPLKHTDVNGQISGFLARVVVTQEFVNPSHEPIEAVYKFPLPPDSAVDNMKMTVGKRVITGLIKEKQEARKMFDEARQNGRTAALLDQERPNIFTQSVTNIAPGETVRITIEYVETMKYEDGSYEFVFPMVVGPRYTPASMQDPRSVLPHRTPEGTRAGHDINIKVSVDAGMPLGKVASTTHDVDVLRADAGHVLVALKNAQTIPNKDFILRYDVAGAKIQDAVLAHADAQRGGFVTLILQPPDRVVESEVTPKEIVFVVDTSGSMHGFPLEKTKEVIERAFQGLHSRDTFNLITFSGDEHILFPKPVPATPENIRIAWEFMRSRSGRGGTEMMKAIKASLEPSDSQDHVRIVCFMTDGEVGNDLEILGEIQKHPKARVFAFGIGSSTNRFLLDGMARYGRGEVQYVGLQDDGSAAARAFHERVRTPLLTDIEIDWNGLPVRDIFPARIPDLFSAKPVVLSARYTGAVSNGTIRLRGKIAGKPFVREIAVRLPASEPRHDVLATLWARRKVADLMASDFDGVYRNTPRMEIKQQITQLGLDFRLMTQYTSFVAVEDRIVNDGGRPPRVVQVPVEMPEGVSYVGVYGSGQPMVSTMESPVGGVLGGGAFRSKMAQAPPPSPMTNSMSMDQFNGVSELKKERVSKLDPSLLAVDGKAMVEVEVWLNGAVTPQLLQRLKAAGLTVAAMPAGGSSLVKGRIEASKLQALEAMAEVRFVGPVRK